MDNDLISRSEVIKLIESKFVDGCLEQEDKTLIDGYGLLDDVSDMPTAYDVDKVVERLEEKKKVSERYRKSHLDDVSYGESLAYDKSIKCVKSGGIE